MEYYEACLADVSRKEAVGEILQHGDYSLVQEFYSEAGKKDEYSGQEVLDFLGY